MGIDFKIKGKKLESDTRLNEWHHEEYSRNRINSVTISSKRHRYKTHNGTSILDNINRIDNDILKRNINFIANVLYHVIYDNEDDMNVNINERYMNNYLNYLNRVPRFGPYHYKSAYLKKLRTDLQSHSHETQIMQYPENEFIERFYSTLDSIGIEIFEVKPYCFDLLLTISTLIYLFIFYVAINRPKNINEFLALFASD